MAAGDCTISGAYAISDKAGIKAFIESVSVAKAGESIFIIPAGKNTIMVGVVEGGAA